MNNARIFENGYQGTEAYPEYVDHYFCFPTQSDADEASKLFLARGWRVLVTPGAAGTDWLALATQPAHGDEDMGPLWHELAKLASQFGGNYDGFERPAGDEENLS
jgi:regulator of ribonuclease activity B